MNESIADVRIAVLDEYQRVALQAADWTSVEQRARVEELLRTADISPSTWCWARARAA